jgi:hypothetical protein
MIVIYVDEVSERLIYTLDFVFKNRGLDYKITNDFHAFERSKSPKLNYSEREFHHVVQLKPATVLFEEEVKNYQVELGLFQNEECLIFNGQLDPLASIFFTLTRMEEYSSLRQDKHGRFAAEFSIQFKFKLLKKAVCDRWAEAFLEWTSDHSGVSLPFLKKEPKICPTFDIDNAYAYSHKKGVRKWMSTGRDILKRDTNRLAERKRVLNESFQDPYDTYDYIESIVKRGYDVTIFWLLGDYAQYDKNISHQNKHHQKLIQRLNKTTTVGLHPSYKSNTYANYLLNEKERLESILDCTVEHSRLHFLMLNIKQTYKIAVSQGFKHDYTMGYADQVGFRAGTARPFYWFDLENNHRSDLLIHPFVYMDGTLNEYLHLSPLESMQLIGELYQEVTTYGGDFSFIWHNETIGNYGKWVGWKDVLEHTLNLKRN